MSPKERFNSSCSSQQQQQQQRGLERQARAEVHRARISQKETWRTLNQGLDAEGASRYKE